MHYSISSPFFLQGEQNLLFSNEKEKKSKYSLDPKQ